jgi:hypothetical protein
MDGINGEVGCIPVSLRHNKPVEPGDPELLYGDDQYGRGTAHRGQ